MENGRVISDMDASKASHQDMVDVLQNGITTGKKIILDGSAVADIAVSWKVDNFVMRNIHIKGNTGYSCCEPESGTALQYTGAVFENCIFDGGNNGIKTNGLVDYVNCVNCYSNASGTGFNLNDAGNGGKSAVLCGCVADGCGVGVSVTGGHLIGCITNGCTDAVEANGICGVVSCVLYDCGDHAFVCSNTKARWYLFNSIAVLDPAASGVFGVGAGGGSVVFEDHTAVIATVADTSDYDQPADMKSIYEVCVDDGALLDKITYRQYLEYVELGTSSSGVPTKYALRHGKLWLWPIPDAVYSVTVDFSMYHPASFTDILFGPEFNEAIYHGVLKALYEGQFKQQLKLSEQTIDTDETLKLKFYEQFPQAKLHAKQYENEIAKLIGNLEVDTETVLVEYRDI